ncbi:MAG: hypothetical protein WC758_07485 [Candidatus Woesearchaeota archaeon]|jgi:hypothetical protein
MELNKEQKDALKEFNKKIMSCACGPSISGKYCDNCKKLMLDFIDKYGMGILCNDIPLENLQKENTILKNENNSLQIQLNKKTKDYEELRRLNK